MRFKEIGITSTVDYNNIEVCDLDKMKTEEEALLETPKTDDNGFVTGAKIDESYEDYLDLLRKQHEVKGRIDNINEEMIVINSINGAENLKSKKSVTSVISYSSQMYLPSMITAKKISAGSSTNILTWQQVRDLESANIMILSAQSHYQHKSTLYNKPNYQLYDMHDAKMLYVLLHILNGTENIAHFCYVSVS